MQPKLWTIIKYQDGTFEVFEFEDRVELNDALQKFSEMNIKEIYSLEIISGFTLSKRMNEPVQ